MDKKHSLPIGKGKQIAPVCAPIATANISCHANHRAIGYS